MMNIVMMYQKIIGSVILILEEPAEQRVILIGRREYVVFF
jgi:hypothetical protein